MFEYGSERINDSAADERREMSVSEREEVQVLLRVRVCARVCEGAQRTEAWRL